MTEVHFLSATELAEKILTKQLSSLELTQHFIDRIERHDDQINAVVVRDFDRAIDSAQLPMKNWSRINRRDHFTVCP